MNIINGVLFMGGAIAAARYGDNYIYDIYAFSMASAMFVSGAIKAAHSVDDGDSTNSAVIVLDFPE